MSNKIKKRQTLEEILQSTSGNLFPAKMGRKLVKVNSIDCMGDTPLHVMVWRKDRYAVDILIENGANVNAVGDMGETPLHVAISQEDEVIIQSLLNAGAQTDIRSEFNKTPLEKANDMGGSIVKLFKEHALHQK